MSILVEDYEIKQPVLISNCVRIDVEGVELFRTAKLRITFVREDTANLTQQFLSSEIYYLTQEEYDLWGDDDTYLETLVLTKYGLKKREIPPPAPVEETEVVPEVVPASL